MNRCRELPVVRLAYRITMRAFSAQPIVDLKGMTLRTNTTPAYRDVHGLLGATPLPAGPHAMPNGRVDGLEAHR